MSIEKMRQGSVQQPMSIDARRQTGKKLLTELKRVYQKLTPKHREAIRLMLTEAIGASPG